MKSIVFLVSLCKRCFLSLVVIVNFFMVFCFVKCEMLICLKILFEIFLWLDSKIFGIVYNF